MIPSSTFFVVGYLSLAAGMASRAAEERRGASKRAPALAGRGNPALGNTLSAEAARAASPIFRQRAKATIYSNLDTIEARAKKIADLINRGAQDPAVRKAAIAVVARRCPQKPGGWCIEEKDYRGEAEALFHFVRRNVRYTRDHPTIDTFVHPARTLFDVAPGSGGGGDCDDETATLGALLKSIGHTVKMRIGAIIQGGETRPNYNHIWLLDYLPSGGAIAGPSGQSILALDASVDKPPGWQAPRDRIYRVRDFAV